MNRAPGHRKGIRVGLVVPSLGEGGVAAVADFMCATIDRSGAFDSRIVCLSSSWRDDLGVAITSPFSWHRGVRKAEGSWRGRRCTWVGAALSEIELQRYRPRLLLREVLSDCQLIQVVCGSPALAYAVCDLGVPVAVHCATRAVVERRSRAAKERGMLATWRRGMTLLVDCLERTALRSVDAVQVESAWMRDYVRLVTAGRPVLIRDVVPGVDTTRFTPLSKRDLQADSYVLCVGRFNDERKNVRLLLEAFALLTHERRSSTRLVLAGSAAPKPGFWQRARELGLEERVRYVASPGPDELVRLYQSASACALSSDEEGFGIVIIEAMSCAVPVVATRCGGPEGIIRDGCDGYLVGVGNVREMTDRLERLLSDAALNRRLGDAGRRAVLARFDRRVAGHALLETYEALLAGRCV